MNQVEPVLRTHRVGAAAPAEVFDVVADFEAYPRLFREISAARVVSRDANRVRAEFRMALLLPVRYVLDLVCDRPALTIDWTFVEGDIVNGNQGGWRFRAQDSDTLIDYRIALSLAAPVPGFILRKVTDGLVSLSLPAMFRAIEQEVRARQKRA